MSNKNPFIKFEARSQDNLKTPGGGSNNDPTWVLRGKEILNHSDKLISEFDDINNKWDETNISGLPHTISIKIIDKAKSKSHQSQITPLFKVDENIEQIGFDGERTILMTIYKKKDINNIKSKFKEIDSNRVPISAVNSVSLYNPKIGSTIENHSYKLIPIDYKNKSLNDVAIKKIMDELEANKIEAKVVNYTENVKIFKIYNANLDSLKFINNLPIRYSGPMEKTSTSFFYNHDNKINAKKLIAYDKNKTYPLVGLLDSGVQINELTKGWVSRGNGCRYSDNELNTSHGTYIANLLIHGDELGNNKDSSISGCNIIDVPIVPNYSVDGDILVQNIEKAIKLNSGVKVWNLSVSLDKEILKNEFSNFAISLDKIQKKYNVIICKSSGNDANFINKKHPGKLSVGADSVRSITVGSISRGSDKYNYTKKDFPSPYSRTGKGPANMIKPELVHYGGDFFAQKNNPKKMSDLKVVSDTSSIDGVDKIHKAGTSFSTPKISKQISELRLLTNNQYNNLTLKALTIHSSKYSREINDISSELKLKSLGFGKPEKTIDSLYDSNFSSTLILNDCLERGKRIDIMDFPYPDDLISNGRYIGKIKLTLICDPVLISGQGDEYCQSNLDIKFGTYEKKSDSSDFLKMFNPIKRENPSNLLLDTNYSKREIKNNKIFSNERMLIKYGNKYQTIKKFTFDLSELTNKNKELTDISRKWFLFLEGHYRNFAEQDSLKNDYKLSIPFSLVITIEDPDKKINVYSSTIKSLNSNNFLHNQININNNISINN